MQCNAKLHILLEVICVAVTVTYYAEAGDGESKKTATCIVVS